LVQSQPNLVGASQANKGLRMFSTTAINSFYGYFKAGVQKVAKKQGLVTGFLGKDLDPLLKLRCRIDYQGQEHIPSKGPYLIAINHLRNEEGFLRAIYDAFAVSWIFYQKRKVNIRWIGRLNQNRDTMHMGVPGFGRFMPMPFGASLANMFERKYGALLIKEEDLGKSKHLTIKKTIQCLQAGQVVGLAPEGDLQYELSKAKRGVYYIAKGCLEQGIETPVIPIAVWWDKRKIFFRRRQMQIRIAPSLRIDPLQPAQAEADRVMIEIAKLLPEQYRGYYKEYV